MRLLFNCISPSLKLLYVILIVAIWQIYTNGLTKGTQIWFHAFKIFQIMFYLKLDFGHVSSPTGINSLEIYMLLCDKGVATGSLLVSLVGIIMYHIVNIKMAIRSKHRKCAENYLNDLNKDRDEAAELNSALFWKKNQQKAKRIYIKRRL